MNIPKAFRGDAAVSKTAELGSSPSRGAIDEDEKRRQAITAWWERQSVLQLIKRRPRPKVPRKDGGKKDGYRKDGYNKY